MKKLNLNSLGVITTGLALTFCLLGSSATAATLYFDSNGTAAGYGSGGSWDGANWATASGGTTATGNWVDGSFAEFLGAGTYAVTVNASEGNTGIYNDNASLALSINDAGSGTGNLNVETAIQGFLSTSGSSTYINVPIVGNGGVAPELSGSIYFNAANSYTGGTALGDSGNTLTYFNNNLSFSTGLITLNRTGIANFSTLLSYGGAPLTLANNFQITSAVGTGTALNFASGANTPVTVSGTLSLGPYNLNLRNAGGSTAPLTLSGAISGSGILALSANGTGSKTILSGANPFTGTIIVTGSGGTYGGNNAITLTLGAANTIASSSSVTMSGGTLDPNGFHPAMASTTLGLTASSTIDYGAGSAELDFANSSSLSWSGVLNLVNWTGQGDGVGPDELRFGIDATGLTGAQLADIEINGQTGPYSLDASGFLVVPEPSTGILVVLGGLGLLGYIRRRTA